MSDANRHPYLGRDRIRRRGKARVHSPLSEDATQGDGEGAEAARQSRAIAGEGQEARAETGRNSGEVETVRGPGEQSGRRGRPASLDSRRFAPTIMRRGTEGFSVRGNSRCEGVDVGDITPDAIETYVDMHLATRDAPLAAVEAQGAREKWPIVGPAEGTLLHVLTRLVNAKRALELGTAIGYSATWIARGLAAGGELLTVERDPDTAKLAAENLRRTGVADRVRILVGDAREIVKDLEGPFDLIFNDIDKEGYPVVLPRCADLLRVGGVLVTDNVLWSGSVANRRARDASTAAIRTYNDRLAADARFLSVIVPLRDGVSAALKVR